MTKKLFWEHPYQTSLETVVEAVSSNFVTLRETIFYAFSGGQESDSGTIGGYPISEACKRGLDIVYALPDGHALKPGDAVSVCIDWERRYRLMRLHFAAELILELVCRDMEGINKIGAHIAVDKARIDFLWPHKISEAFPQLITQTQSLIDRDLEIVSDYSDEESQRRYWKIPGFARVDCGGTHLKRTGEVGSVSLKRKNIGKGKERIEVYV